LFFTIAVLLLVAARWELQKDRSLDGTSLQYHFDSTEECESVARLLAAKLTSEGFAETSALGSRTGLQTSESDRAFVAGLDDFGHTKCQVNLDIDGTTLRLFMETTGYLSEPVHRFSTLHFKSISTWMDAHKK
jgi:hypothetical protein